MHRENTVKHDSFSTCYDDEDNDDDRQDDNNDGTEQYRTTLLATMIFNIPGGNIFHTYSHNELIVLNPHNYRCTDFQ